MAFVSVVSVVLRSLFERGSHVVHALMLAIGLFSLQILVFVENVVIRVARLGKILRGGLRRDQRR